MKTNADKLSGIAGYFIRQRPKWDDRAPWTAWKEVDEASHADIVKIIATGEAYCGWFYEARILYTENPSNALVVEGVALRHIVERIVNNLYAAGYEPEENSLHPWKSLIFDAEKALNTPATSAALAAIEVRGVEKLIKLKMEQLASMHPDTHAFGATAESLSTQINELQAFAAQLREGK